MKKIYDPIRQSWVAATPEEVVRQTWIQRMIQELQFPKQLIAVEKELKALPHLTQDRNTLPSRRIDLLCFIRKDEDLSPLLLIECKESALTGQALDQVIAYNHYVKAAYIAIVNQSQVRFRYQSQNRQYELSRLPSYSELMEGLSG